MSKAVRVWDLPTRLFHWLLVGCFVGSLVSVSIGGNAMAWHFRFGYATLALIAFRVVWGFVGPRYARFSSFPPNPAAALRHLSGGAVGGGPGHNPLGAFSVYAMLLAFAFQAGTGLFANDSIAWDGPLRHLVSDSTSDLLTRLHKINRFVVIALILLHLGAIAWYVRVRHQPLLRPMLRGDRDFDDAERLPPAAADGPRERLRAIVLIAACAFAVWWLVNRPG